MTTARALVASLAVCCAALAAPLAAADAPTPAATAPAAAPAPQPAVNQTYLDSAIHAATAIAEACKASGAASKIGGLLGGGSAPAAGDDKLKQAEGLVADLQALKAGKAPAAGGAFQQLVVDKKDGIATAFKGVPGADRLQAAFGDGGIGKALLAATPVDQVPGYQTCADALALLGGAKK